MSNITTKVVNNEGDWMVQTNDGRDFGPYATRKAARAAATSLATSLNEPVVPASDEAVLEALAVTPTEDITLDELADVIESVQAEADDEAAALLLADLKVAHEAGDKATRNALINQVIGGGVRTTSQVAELLGMSYAGVHRLVGREATAPRVSKAAQARLDLLNEIADLAVGDKTRDASLLLIEEFLTANGVTRDWIAAA